MVCKIAGVCVHMCLFLVRTCTAGIRYFRQCEKVKNLHGRILKGSF